MMDGHPGFVDKLKMDITTLIGADFACGAVLISMGAVLGKLSHAQLLVMALIEVIFWALSEHIGA
jgi:ammonium transporter Rh